MGWPLTRGQIVSHRFVLSLEGNDVATNLKWLLASSSVVVMPTPTKESWLMEGLLRPYVHYLPLNSPDEAPALLPLLKAVGWLEALHRDRQAVHLLKKRAAHKWHRSAPIRPPNREED